MHIGIVLSRRRGVGSLLVLACAVSSGCGCGPQATLHVWPQAYCPGTPIHLAWDATGDTYLRVSPTDQAFTSVPSSGFTYLPSSQATIDLEAKRHNRRDAAQIVIAPAASRPFVGDALDCDAQLARTHPIEIRPGDYDLRAQIQSISSRCQSDNNSDPCPTITVCHGSNPTDPCTGTGSRIWQVAPDHPADLSHESVGMAGFWVLARKLAPGESCGPAATGAGLATPAAASQKMTHLSIQLTLSCAPEGAMP